MKENLHFDNRSTQAVSRFFSSQNFLKETEHMFSLFLSSLYRNTRESLGELKKVVGTVVFPQLFRVLPNFHDYFD